MNFEQILPALRDGKRISRQEWNGSSVLKLNGDNQIVVNPQNEDDTSSYVPNQNDILADDWYALED